MAKNNTMTQCKLGRKDIIDIAWIPNKFAKVGKYLRIKEVNGWKVLEVWNSRSANEVRDRERDYLKTRKASDI